MPIDFDDLEGSKKTLQALAAQHPKPREVEYLRIDPTPFIGAEVAACAKSLNGVAQQSPLKPIKCHLKRLGEAGIVICNSSCAQELSCRINVALSGDDAAYFDVQWIDPYQEVDIPLAPAQTSFFGSKPNNEKIHIGVRPKATVPRGKDMRLNLEISLSLQNDMGRPITRRFGLTAVVKYKN